MPARILTEENEAWKPVVGYEGLYEVSNLGRVKRLAEHRPTQLIPNRYYNEKNLKLSWSHGDKGYSYLRVMLYKDGSRKHFLVHDLVLTSFHGRRPKGADARHLNGVKADNRASNLKWGTPYENYLDMVAHGTFRRGSRCAHAKLKEEDVRNIRFLLAQGRSGASLARQYGLSESAMTDIKHRRSWKHVD